MVKISRAMVSVVVASLVLAGCGNEKAPTSDAAQSNPAGYQLGDKEKALLSYLLMDELEAFADGGDALDFTKAWAGNPVIVSAKQLQAEYEKNEVAGDQKYRGKFLLVSGKVTSIDRSVGENYFIGLAGGANPYINPKAKMADGYTDYLAALEKGQNIKLACTGDGMLMGSAVVSQCQPFENYASAKVQTAVSSVNKDLPKLMTSPDAKSYLDAIVITVAAAPHLSADSKCLSDKRGGTACQKEIESIAKKPGFKDDLANAARNLGVAS